MISDEHPEPLSSAELTAKLHATTDAQVWAQEFCRLFGGDTVDEGLMIGWFANAMCVAVASKDAEIAALREERDDLADALWHQQKKKARAALSGPAETPEG